MVKKIPSCVGEYEQGVDCDGDQSSLKKTDYLPCKWRNRCVAFKQFLADRKKKINEYLNESSEQFTTAKKGDLRFIALCDAHIKNYGVKNGIVTIKKEKPKLYVKKRTTEYKNKLSRAIKKRQKLVKKFAVKNFALFKMNLIENLDTAKFAQPGGIIIPGSLYFDIRTATIQQIVHIKYRNKNAKIIDKSVVKLLIKKSEFNFDVFLPIDSLSFNGINEDIIKLLNPKPVKNKNEKRFKSVMRKLNSECIVLAAKTIAILINNETIEL